MHPKPKICYSEKAMSYDLKKLFSARIAVLVLAVLIFSGASLQSSSAQDLFNRQGDGISGVERDDDGSPQLFLSAPGASGKAYRNKKSLLSSSLYVSRKMIEKGEPSVWKQMNALAYQNKKADIKQALELQKRTMKIVHAKNLEYMAQHQKRAAANKAKFEKMKREQGKTNAYKADDNAKSVKRSSLPANIKRSGGAGDIEPPKKLYNTPY